MSPWVALFGLLGLAAPEGPRRYSQLSLKDLEAMAPVLQAQVAEVRIELVNEGPLSGDEERTVYGVPWGPRRVVVLAPLLEDARRTFVRGPKGELPAEILLSDPVRRVAILGTARPLSEIGLVIPGRRPARERKTDDEVFAPIATTPGSGVVHGVITDDGTEPEYEGHPRVDLKLERGMPVFDDQARLVGYSRVVAYDQDRFMVITPEQIRDAQTATASGGRPKKAAPDSKPWWAR